ncbi:TNF receptor-associated factor 3-like isoform X2 [Dendronephthya gigantea]|nr:TNF receptor-associated factor 3-like isoform X2 [Dendronephthya gigantea]XP_028417570.1 TNF receptor-associated factor 3-like isoform X2 [Dendronephthya gigantea]XP_028417571.1 TNF receptor-associated factor 3-like isoform X2 [Dendronephthya gigantea]XP_028417573.1 TNF receptor-associated factor 3-like isoform X2 [Dendronephthya gigantea]
MPGTKITDEDRKTISMKFICAICHLLLVNPMQTNCGHLICLSCLEALLGGSSTPRCPEDGEELSRDKVFPDAFTKRELKLLKIHCTNSGCTWFSAYGELEAHFRVCEHTSISCAHPQCKTQFKRVHLGEHLKSECEYRNVKCKYCQKDVEFASIQNHIRTSCEGTPVTCKYCKQKVLRRDTEDHELLICEEIPVDCVFQPVGCNHSKTLKRGKLEEHMNKGLPDHVRLLLQHVLAAVSQLKDYVPRPEFTRIIQKLREDLQQVCSGVAEKFSMVEEKFNGLNRRVDGLEQSPGSNTRVESELHGLVNKIGDISTESSRCHESSVVLERGFRETDAKIQRFLSRMDQVDECLALNTVKITDLECQGTAQAQHPIHSYNGTLLWKIDGFQRKRQDAITGKKTALYSEHFYSAQYGYRMCAKIYMNGDGFGKGTHLSLFFVVVKGDYDALQAWPFRKKITMMLLDQGSGDHMVDAFHSDPTSSSFQRPKSEMNIASGSPLFMPLDNMSNRQFVKDDVMFIKIIVD